MTDAFVDVLIIGGGVMGLTAAIAMRQRGFSVALLDAKPINATPNNRVYAINQASQQLLQRLDIWPAIDPQGLSPYHHMHVWDSTNGAHIDFDSRMIGTDKLGVILDESALKKVLIQQVLEQGVVCIPECAIQSVQSTPEGIMLHSDLQSWQARLLIVADGSQSVTREQLGVSITLWPYHHHALVSTVQTEKPHQHTAWQVFNPDGPLAFLPLMDSHQSSIVWSTSPNHAEQLMGLSEDDFARQLEKAFSNKLGTCQLLTPRYLYPLMMRHAKQYSGRNWLLMGDAAHTIHPLAGLGLNLGFADLNCWLNHLDANQNQLCSQKALGAYQRERKHAVWQTIALMEGLKTLFANPLFIFKLLRGVGLSACNNLPALKRLFMAHAAG